MGFLARCLGIDRRDEEKRHRERKIANEERALKEQHNIKRADPPKRRAPAARGGGFLEPEYALWNNGTRQVHLESLARLEGRSSEGRSSDDWAYREADAILANPKQQLQPGGYEPTEEETDVAYHHEIVEARQGNNVPGLQFVWQNRMRNKTEIPYSLRHNPDPYKTELNDKAGKGPEKQRREAPGSRPTGNPRRPGYGAPKPRYSAEDDRPRDVTASGSKAPRPSPPVNNGRSLTSRAPVLNNPNLKKVRVVNGPTDGPSRVASRAAIIVNEPAAGSSRTKTRAERAVNGAAAGPSNRRPEANTRRESPSPSLTRTNARRPGQAEANAQRERLARREGNRSRRGPREGEYDPNNLI